MEKTSLISDVRLFPINGNTSVKANGDFIYNGVMKVKITLVHGSNGLFVSLPRKKGKDKEGKETWYPEVLMLDKDLREELNAKVVEVFNNKSAPKETAKPTATSTALKGNTSQSWDE